VDNIPWHAFYFESFKNTSPPVLTEVIEAQSMTEAAKIATMHMGRLARVEIASPIWVEPQACTILASEEQREAHAGRFSN
jgi:hypothetical protein